MPVYFLSANFEIETIAAIERQVRTAIPDLIKIRSLEEVPQGAAEESNQQSYVLLVASAKESGHFGKIIEAASRNRGHMFLILISDDISANDYKRLVRTGGADWVSASAIPQEILDIMSRQRAGSQSTSARRAQPVVVSFVPSAGGVGNTTLAVEMSTRLGTSKATANRRICIVDLDFQRSHVCDYLDIEPRLQIQEISSNPERLDDQLFNIFVSRHSSGLHVFAAPRTNFNSCDLNVVALDKLFDMISTRYDLIVIDLPAAWLTWTSQVIAGSDGVIVTGINTIPGLRQMTETVAAVRDACSASGQVAVAVNRCEHRLIGGIARRQHVEKVLGREKVFYVRDDPMMVQCINTGTPMALVNAGRKASKEIAVLGAFCAGLRSSQVVSA
jgi:pilus assembly protein CpaE